MLLLCCGVLCPCFHAKRKEKSEHSVLDRELKSSLYGKILDFSQRLEIAIDVAHALTYLHLYAVPYIRCQNTTSCRVQIGKRLAPWKHSEGNVQDILDPLLEEKVDDDIVGMMLDLAFDCAAPTRSSRPAMKEIVEQLWEIRKRYGKILRGMSGSLHQ
ncbi:hypothetical protein BHE74_00046657 [Ensete ventricosum]|uniref:Protein kinase domain-containing protein n=1 Tax=Ensete ventricosum TaxID=4639 RepID=A0A426YUK7_ENSVE|nr:hypothetical protein B296_00032235 [Ensete ventricosum]RWW47357.1 hypothetical protein BHE74_00046657 [Ensete ventricosum]